MGFAFWAPLKGAKGGLYPGWVWFMSSSCQICLTKVVCDWKCFEGVASGSQQLDGFLRGDGQMYILGYASFTHANGICQWMLIASSNIFAKHEGNVMFFCIVALKEICVLLLHAFGI